MELSVREWMIIIGVLLIMAVLLDGYRRVHGERRNRIRVTLSKQARQRGISTPSAPLDNTPPPEVVSELPNGGARVIAKVRRDDLKLNESVPVLMESVHIAPLVEDYPEKLSAADYEEEVDEVAAKNLDRSIFDESLADKSLVNKSRANELHAESDEIADPRAVDFAAQEFDTPESDVRDKVEPYFDEQYDVEPELELSEPDIEPQVQATPAREVTPKQRKTVEARTFHNTSLPNSAAQEVIIVNVISKDPSGFKGQDLLQILLACDLRFGNMNIFHRYEKANGKGAVQFSVANLVEPGIFDLDRIDNFSTPGLCFFLALPGPEKAIVAFNYMIETAQVLVKNLQAELRDEAHSVMTQQTIEHCRQRIRDFERKQLTLHL